MPELYLPVENSSFEEVKDLIAEHCSSLENHLIIIGSDIGTRSERMWDLVGVDERKGIALIKIIMEYNDDLINQIIEHTEWVWENLNNISRIYPSWGINEDIMPKIFIAAPKFPDSFIKLISYTTGLNTNLFTFRHVYGKSGSGILLERVELHELMTPLTFKDLKKEETSSSTKLAELTDEEIKEFLGNY